MSDYSEEVLNSPKRFGLGTCGDCGNEVKYDRLGINKDECPFCGSSSLVSLRGSSGASRIQRGQRR